MRLMRKLFGQVDSKHVREEQSEIERKMDSMSKELNTIINGLDKRYVDAFYVIKDSEKGDRHPLFPNIKLHQYDIDYAKKLVDRLETYQDQREE